MSTAGRCLARGPLTPRLLPSLFRLSRKDCCLPAKARSFHLLHAISPREESKKKWRVGLVSCFKNDEKSTSNDDGFEFVEIRSDRELDKPMLDPLENEEKHWIIVIQKAINKIFPVLGEPWTVPWKAETIVQVMLLWTASFWFVGSWIVPFLGHAAGFSKESLSHRGQALYSLLTDIAEGLAGITILHACLARFRPLPPGWFCFTLRGSWHLDVGLGCLLFPIVNFLSQININLVPVPTSPPVGVSSVEQSIIARDPVAMALYAVVVSVCAPVWEEIVFRGFLLPSLTRYMPLWCAVVASAVAFALAHFNGQRLLPLVFLGMVMGAVFARSRNLLASMVLHSLWNGFVFLDLMK
ncbi:uncharacterized protein LOC110020988 [Phalaenopsis equestris]|uniref:uncharacterized protein LOC110020988 n=1 Tax=Phalaenopsis equestris TaxID=78828 RepID=UPI0009E53A44|nr:uncharacterized protein LOC110020988 [Phalaenopsis equestris]